MGRSEIKKCDFKEESITLQKLSQFNELLHGVSQRKAEAPPSGFSLIHHRNFSSWVLGSLQRYTHMERLAEITQNSSRPQRIPYSHTVVGIYLPCAMPVLSCRDTECWDGSGGKGPLGIISLDSCWKHSQLQQVAQDHVVLGLECLQGWRLHNLLEKHSPVFYHPTSRKVFFFLLRK